MYVCLCVEKVIVAFVFAHVSPSLFLAVSVPPDILDYPTSSDMVVHEGSNVTLQCAATGYPNPTITWRREDNRNIVISNALTGKTRNSRNGFYRTSTPKSIVTRPYVRTCVLYLCGIQIGWTSSVHHHLIPGDVIFTRPPKQ